VFIISVKYDSGTVVGQSEPDPSTVNYNFTTSVDGAFVSQDGTALVKKVSGGALMAGDGETSTPATAHEDLHWTEGLATGTFTVAIDVVDPAQSAQVAVAIGELNAALAPFGTALELAGPGIEADIQLRVAEETFVGGVAEGVLGFTSPAGQITIVAGWDWYLGDGGIQPGQFDFQTAVEHELVHALGGDHTDDFGSLMFPVLAPAGEIALAAPLDLSAALQAGGVGSAIGETIRAAVPPSFRLLPPQMIREHAVRWPLPLLDRRDGFGWTASILQEQPGRHDFELTMPGRSDADDHRNPLPTADDVNGGFDETPAEESLIDALFGDGFTLDALLFPASQTA
jgi:hypothetical protein